MAAKRSAHGQDPDYEEVTIHQNKRQKTIEKDGKEVTKRKIEVIIKQQFAREILHKEQEILKIDDRIHQCKTTLDKLRASIVARYYGFAGQHGAVSIGRVSSHQPGIHPSVKKLLGKTTRSSGSYTSIRSNTTAKKNDIEGSVETFSRPATPSGGDKANKEEAKQDSTKKNTETKKSSSAVQGDGKRSSRFKVKKRIIVGNVSKYIPVDKREENDPATHKWMVYVRGPQDEANISSFVKKVWFFLHPSYRPNDLVELSQHPFQLTRRGWGEFPIRVQLHFKDTRNKRVDIIHLLKLDKTYTGLQTLGAETTVDIEIEREDAPSATITKAQPQATSTPLQTLQKAAMNGSSSKSSSVQKNLDSSGNSVDSEVQDINSLRKFGSEVSDTSLESESLGVFTPSKPAVVENGLKRTSSVSSNISSSSELFALDRRKSSLEDRTTCTPRESHVASASARSPSEVSTSSVSRGTSPDFTSMRIKQEPVDEPVTLTRNKRKRREGGGIIPPQGIKIKTEPMDTDEVCSAVTTPDSGIGIKPESLDVSRDSPFGSEKSMSFERPEFIASPPASVQSQANPVPQSVPSTSVPSVKSTEVSSESVVTTPLSPKVSAFNLNSKLSPQVPKSPGTSAMPTVSPAQHLYIKCIDPQGNLCLVPQHLLIKTPPTTPIGKPIVTSPQSVVKTVSATNQNISKSPAMLQTVVIPTQGINQNAGKPVKGSMPVVRASLDPNQIRSQSPGIAALQPGPGSIFIRAAPPPSAAGQKTPPGQKIQNTTKTTPEQVAGVQLAGKSDQVTSRLKPPGSVSLLNRTPLATSVKATPGVTPALLTMAPSVARQPLPQQPGKNPSSLLTLKNLTPLPPAPGLTPKAEQSQVTSTASGQHAVINITSQNSVTSADAPNVVPPATAQLVKANIGGKLVWLQLFPNQKPGAGKPTLNTTLTASSVKAETSVGKQGAMFSGIGKPQGMSRTNAPDGNITITMGLGNYQTSAMKCQKTSNKSGMQNFTIRNNTIFHQEACSTSTKPLPKDMWKYRQKKCDDVKQSEKPVNPSVYNDFTSLLKAVVKQYPILHQAPDRTIHPYCAKNVQDYYKWNVGKRRAAEWQRASDVQNRIQNLLKNSTTFKGEKIWTTKRIMIWCRHHLFTPYDPGLCKNAVKEVEPLNVIDSYSDVSRKIKDLHLEEQSQEDDTDSDVEIIDIIETGDCNKWIKKEITSPVKQQEQTMKLYMPITPEVDYVRDMTSKVGVHLKSVEVEPSVFSPMVENMIFSTMKEFTEDILRNAARLKIENQSSCEELTVTDLFKSIRKLKQCDFLTNFGLGSEIEKKLPQANKPS